MTTLPTLTTAHQWPARGCALVEAFLASQTERTRRAYGGDLRDFAAFMGAPDVDAAAAALLSLPHGEANAQVLAYRTHLTAVQLAPATIRRRLAAIRALVKLARLVGAVPWTLDISGPRAAAYRDTTGPGVAGVRRLLETAAKRPDDAKRRRDRALIRLLFDLGLRRAEVVSLDVPAHVDLTTGRIWLMGKGKREREAFTLPSETRAALAAWIEARGSHAGPLFTALDPYSKGKRLTGHGVRKILMRLGDKAGVRARPHGIRHTAITAMLDLTNGDVRQVRKFSRHAKVETVLSYDDSRTDTRGELARRLARAL